jgi:hypothetical protein
MRQGLDLRGMNRMQGLSASTANWSTETEGVQLLLTSTHQ